ncbi:hypothetical protein GGI1_14983 [Acidithiobacillus sp. GGI-221]|nr:hypothetical protein GGI1_14983 [Acidithiobacillus sp. GGI-221]
MGREDELPFAFLIPHRRYNTFGNEAIVEVILRLINDERSFRFKQQ